MSTSSVKLFRAADIFRNVIVKKSKAKWFIHEALHVFGARSIFLQSSKKDPVNTGFVVHIGQEKDQVDVLVQTEKELVFYELMLKNIQIRECSVPLQKILGPEINVDALGEYFVSDPKWKFVECDSVKLALRLGILKPPQGCKAQDILPHNKEWDIYKAREEARLKAQVSARRDDLLEEDVEEDPASKIDVPKYMVPKNTPAEETESEGEEPFPVTQTPKVQPLSALNEVELKRDDKNQIRRVAITRCLVDQSVLRIPIEQFHVPSCDSNSENWSPYQIRACSRSFVSDLKKHMQSNAYAHYPNFILLVDPWDCKDKASWVFPPPSKWRFYVIGGNHSALARMELLAQYPGIYTHYRHCNCIVYADLSKTKTSLFAHNDNFDAEVRRKYTFHQRVEYFHRQFMEAKQSGEPMATLRKRLALETMNIGEEDLKTALSTLEGTFQVAFRIGCLWEVQESIFRKWERKKLKSIKGAGKGKKKDDGEMRQTWWRPLQCVSDERKLSILLRVDSGELSLDHMTLECARCKTLDELTYASHASHGVYGYLLMAPGVVALTPCVAWGVNFFPHLSSRVSSDHPMRRMGFTSSFSLYFWSSILMFVPYSLTLPSLVIQKDRYCSNSITKALFGVDEPELEGGKRKRALKAKSLVQVLPPEFLDHIDSARAYKEAKEAGCAVPLPEQNFKHWVKEGSLQSVKSPSKLLTSYSAIFPEKTTGFWTFVLALVLRSYVHSKGDGTMELDKRQFMYLASRVYNMKKLPDADSEVTRGHKHSKDVAPSTCDGGASLVEMSVPETVDDVIRLEKDQVPGSAGTGGSEADDGIEDPEGIDPEVRAGEEVPEHEQNLGQEGIVPDSLVAE
ncbi:hypothetical protein R1sor_024147 [Riccia sorocarpa]|uniref:Uncharacterized protein n=1 Tax=Riccia sorocarpa TaxID=122646 RepID=A0ABD3GTR2_9MARC